MSFNTKYPMGMRPTLRVIKQIKEKQAYHREKYLDLDVQLSFHQAYLEFHNEVRS